MKSICLSLYSYIFSRPIFYSFNRMLFYLSLRGMGFLNYYNHKISGELAVLKLLKKQKISTVVDIGANIGNYIKFVEIHLKPETIYGFEPHPNNYNRLISLTFNKKVIIENLAVSSENSKITLYDIAEGSEHGSVFREQAEQIVDSNRIKSFDVSCVKLDDYCVAKGIMTIDLLKIDVEGAELKVLEGANLLLESKRIRYIQFEFNFANVASRSFMKDFFALLKNYTLYRILTNGLLPIHYNNPELVEIFAFQNILAVLDGEKID